MKILMLSPRIYPQTVGGMEVYNYYFIKEVSQMGHEVSLLSCDTKNLKLNNVKIFRMFTQNIIFQTIQVLLHITFFKYDIIHIPYCSNSQLAIPLSIYKKFKGKTNYVLYIHGGGMHPWNDYDTQLYFFKNAKHIVSISDTITQEYENRTGKKLIKILPLIPFNSAKISFKSMRNNLKLDTNDIIMIYVGSIKKIKGSDFIVDSLITLGKDFMIQNSLKMIFVGDGELKTKLEKDVELNSMSDVILFLGEKKREEIPNYMAMADIFLNASFFEGAPLSILEALYNGLLLISTDVNGVNDIVKNKINGLLFEKDNFNSFKESLLFAINNKITCNNIRQNAKIEIAQNYNYRDNYLKHLELCKN